MSDPIGLISGGGGVRGPMGPNSGPNAGGVGPGKPAPDGAPSFRDVLLENLNQVNAAQRDADKAVEDLMSGRRDDLEGVILATEKADLAFRMLQSMRNKVMQAYDEVKQIRT